MNIALNSNGVLQLTVPEAVIKVQVGSGPVVEIDIVKAFQQWAAICSDAPGDAEDMTLRSEKLVSELGLGSEHNRAEALLFTRRLSELAEPIQKKVIKAAGDNEPSSQPPTDSIVSA